MHISLKPAALAVVPIAAMALLGAGCAPSEPVRTAAQPGLTVELVTSTAPEAAKVVTSTAPETAPLKTVLVSDADPNAYCNGADMDSEGFRKTITKEVPADLPQGAPLADLAKAVALASTTGMCHDALSRLDFGVADGTATIPQIDGWAGVSIVMCGCTPEVEVNLLRIPGIDKVVWK